MRKGTLISLNSLCASMALGIVCCATNPTGNLPARSLHGKFKPPAMPDGAKFRIGDPGSAHYDVLLAVSPDGHQVASSFRDDLLGIWDLRSGAPLVTPEQYGRQVLECLAFSPDSKLLATALDSVSIREVGTNMESSRLSVTPSKKGMRVSIRSIAFSPDGRLLAICGKGVRPQAWDLRDKTVLRSWDEPVHKNDSDREVPLGASGNSIAFSPNGRILASGFDNGTLVLWDVGKGTELRRVRHFKEVDGEEKLLSTFSSLSFFPNSQTMATAGGHLGILLWDVATGQQVGSLSVNDCKVSRVCVSPDGKSMACGGQDRVVIMELSTRTVRRVFHGHDVSVISLCYAPDGQSLASGDTVGHGFVWDVYSRKKAKEVAPGDIESAWCDLLSKDAKEAYPGICCLVRNPEQALSLFSERFRPFRMPDHKTIGKLLSGLDADDFGARERSQRELQALGSAAVPAIREALAAGPSPEAKRRLEELMAPHKPGAIPSPETLRMLRSIEVLEQIGTPEARKLIAHLASGSSEGQLTLEAKAALGRLERRMAVSR